MYYMWVTNYFTFKIFFPFSTWFKNFDLFWYNLKDYLWQCILSSNGTLAFLIIYICVLLIDDKHCPAFWCVAIFSTAKHFKWTAYWYISPNLCFNPSFYTIKPHGSNLIPCIWILLKTTFHLKILKLLTTFQAYFIYMGPCIVNRI